MCEGSSMAPAQHSQFQSGDSGSNLGRGEKIYHLSFLCLVIIVLCFLLVTILRPVVCRMRLPESPITRSDHFINHFLIFEKDRQILNFFQLIVYTFLMILVSIIFSMNLEVLHISSLRAAPIICGLEKATDVYDKAYLS